MCVWLCAIVFVVKRRCVSPFECRCRFRPPKVEFHGAELPGEDGRASKSSADMQARRASDGGHANLGTLSPREILIERLKTLSLSVIEPTGQDGRTCLYLAIAHQLGRAEIPRQAWHASERKA